MTEVFEENYEMDFKSVFVRIEVPGGDRSVYTGVEWISPDFMDRKSS